jgi:hypothetical protein
MLQSWLLGNTEEIVDSTILFMIFILFNKQESLFFRLQWNIHPVSSTVLLHPPPSPLRNPQHQSTWANGGQSMLINSSDYYEFIYNSQIFNRNCRQCFCQQGKAFCSLLACPARPTDCPEENWFRHEGGSIFKKSIATNSTFILYLLL